ncbi:MAG TPA: hypothetical protein VEW66_00260 [Thermomicrobiales bacterium]|nr:hypothetical protein [Thermomicrobiales bacterium]
MMDDHGVPSEEPMSQEERRATRERQLQNSARFTAIAGIIYAILFVASLWLLTDTPRRGATDQEIIAFYNPDKLRTVNFVALYLVPFSGIAFLWFIVCLRMWISTRVERRVNVLFSNIQLVSGIVFLTLLLCAAAALSMTSIAMDVGGEELNPAMAREFPPFGGALFYVFATRMAAMFVFATSNIGRASKIIPGWFVVVSIFVGITLLLTASFNRGLILVFPVWVFTLCVLILIHARQAALEGAAQSDRVVPN